jgi:hypothetical protein
VPSNREIEIDWLLGEHLKDGKRIKSEKDQPKPSSHTVTFSCCAVWFDH